jgi:hypothetical protein
MDQVLTIAHQPRDNTSAALLVAAILAEYPEMDISTLTLERGATQPINAAAVVLLFGEDFESDSGSIEWLKKFDSTRATIPLLPIAVDSDRRHPPAPVSGLKARNWPTDKKEILTTIAASMGLALRTGNNKIFVSYRAVDGTRSAELVEGELNASGFATWRDESNKAYDAPNLTLGDDVQQQIARNIETASALVLIDTPKAGESSWVRLEVELAIGKMIPIFPIVLHDDRVTTQVSRFRVLQSLYRRAVVQSTYFGEELVLPSTELEMIVRQLKHYLMAVYRNRIVQLRELEKFLKSKGCDFGKNEHLPYLHSARIRHLTQSTSLLACCSFEEQIFAPRVRKFVEGMQQLAGLHQMFHQNFYLYPGQALDAADLLEIIQREVPELQSTTADLVAYNEAVAKVAVAMGGFSV